MSLHQSFDWRKSLVLRPANRVDVNGVKIKCNTLEQNLLPGFIAPWEHSPLVCLFAYESLAAI